MRARLFLPLIAACYSLSRAETPSEPGVFARGAGQSDDREIWVQATTFRYAGTAADDVFFLAGDADLSGTFQDDVMGLATLDLNFTGIASQDVRLACLRTAVFNGTAEHDVTLWGSSVELSTNALVKGDAYLSGSTATCQGEVKGDLRLEGGESATLKGKVGGSVRIQSPDIVILPGTRIDGDLIIAGGTDFSLPEGVTLGGTLRQESGSPDGMDSLRRKALLATFIYLAFTSLAFALLQLGLAPLSTQISAQLLAVAWPRCLAAGGMLLGGGFLLMLAGFKLGLGLGFSLLVGAALVLVLFAGQTAVALSLGRRLTGNRPVKSWAGLFGLTVLGLLLMQCALLVPMVGPSLWMVLNFQGAGAIFAHLRQTQRGSALAAYAPPAPPTTTP